MTKEKNDIEEGPQNLQDKDPANNDVTDQTNNEEFATPSSEEQPQTTNSQLQTAPMEVHHHTHPGHHEKKWTDYFWEFLMLFLAVFCGFLAEYQLEHKIERDRVKKYMHDMVQNLRYDTTRVSVNLPSNRSTKQDLDTFRFEIKKAIAGDANLNRLYYFSIKTNEIGLVAFNRASITQLKNSGQLRLVTNDSLVTEMIDYYERRVYAAELYREEAQKALNYLETNINDVFSTTDLDFVTENSDSTFSQELNHAYDEKIAAVLTGKSIPLLKSDKMSLEKLHTAAIRYETALITYNRFLNYAKQGAQKLMVSIEKVY